MLTFQMIFEGLEKEFKQLAREYVRKGWRIDSSGKHDKWIPPHGFHYVTAPKTPSDPRSIKNHQKLLDQYETEEGARQAVAMSLNKRPEDLR